MGIDRPIDETPLKRRAVGGTVVIDRFSLENRRPWAHFSLHVYCAPAAPA
jgi:hypothetical protein